MSIKALQWAWEQNVPNSSRKLVLLALADRANDDGECWPGIASLSEKCSISRSTLIRAVEDLEEQGLLEVTNRPGDGSGRMTNLYRLPIKAPIQKPPRVRAKCQSDEGKVSKMGGKVST